jgi:hypothetical protein
MNYRRQLLPLLMADPSAVTKNRRDVPVQGYRREFGNANPEQFWQSGPRILKLGQPKSTQLAGASSSLLAVNMPPQLRPSPIEIGGHP